MFTKTMIALSAVLVFGTATAAVAMTNGKAHNPRAAFAQSGPAAAYAPNWVVGYDTSGAAIFAGQLTRACPLSLKQQSRC
jgi:hypothetical protein